MEDLALVKKNILTVVEELEGNFAEEGQIPASTPTSFEDSGKEIPDFFIDAVNDLKEREKNQLNEQLKEYLGNDFMKVDDFPETMEFLEATFQSYLAEYLTSGSIDLEQIKEAEHPELLKVFYREVYEFLKNALALLEEN